MRQESERHGARLAAHGRVSARLSRMSDRRLGEAVSSAAPLGSGIGGRAAELDVDGTRVFVKRVPLTELELRPHHVRSTANLFGLPVFYQYGIGSAGFGAWRELAAHTLTTDWVLTGAYPDFPVLHHWRVLPDSPPEGFTDEFGGIEGAVAHWRATRPYARGWRPSAGPRRAWCSSWNTCRTPSRPGWASAAKPPRRAARTRRTHGWTRPWRAAPTS